MFESRRPAFVAAQTKPWRPMATYVLLGAMVATYVSQLAVALRSVSLMDAIFVIDTDWPRRPWSLVTSVFAHGSPTHLLFNGLFLFFLGPAAERIVRRRRYVALFLVAGAISGVVQVFLSARFGEGHGALGASGALMAVFGLLIALMPRQKLLFWGIVPVPFWAMGIFYAVIDVLGAFNPNDGVGNFAHLSGMALGLAYGFYFKGDLKRRGFRLVDS